MHVYTGYADVLNLPFQALPSAAGKVRMHRANMRMHGMLHPETSNTRCMGCGKRGGCNCNNSSSSNGDNDNRASASSSSSSSSAFLLSRSSLFQVLAEPVHIRPLSSYPSLGSRPHNDHKNNDTTTTTTTNKNDRTKAKMSILKDLQSDEKSKPSILPFHTITTSSLKAPSTDESTTPRTTTFRTEIAAFIGELIGTFMFLFMAFTAAQIAVNSTSSSSSNSNSSGLKAGATPPPDLLKLLYISLAFSMSLAVNVAIFADISGAKFVSFFFCPGFTSC